MNRVLVALLLAIMAGTAASARAQSSAAPLRLGILEDMSGVYKDLNGPGDIVSAMLAIEDFGGQVLGRRIEVLSGDMQNSVDVGVGIARRWFDTDNVRAVFGLGNSAVALAVQQLGTEKDRIVVITSGGSTELTGRQCSPLGVQWTYDTYSDASVTGSAVVAAGGRKWFFITADYAFGHSLQDNAEHFVRQGGGQTLGAALAPIGQADYSALLLQARTSGADVVGIAAAGNDMINVVKQMAEFGLIQRGIRPAGLVAYVSDIHAIGLPLAQGLYFTEAFYWDQNAQTRAFSERYSKRTGRPPTSLQASVYGAVLHYLQAVKAVNTDDAPVVMAQMKAAPINDFMTRNGHIRADGRVIRDMYLLQAKAPGESNGEWDLAKVVATVPGDQAFRPLDQGGCPLVR